MSDESGGPAPQHRRARQQGTARPHRIAISVTRTEQEELERAARAEALTVSAFTAEKALAAARRTIPQSARPLREALAELARATAQIQKIGTNLNQAVAALNATGQVPGTSSRTRAMPSPSSRTSTRSSCGSGSISRD